MAPMVAIPTSYWMETTRKGLMTGNMERPMAFLAIPIAATLAHAFGAMIWEEETTMARTNLVSPTV